MKEELYTQENPAQVGVTIQRTPFDTEVNMLPEHCVWMEATEARGGQDSATTDLTSAQTEERLSAVVKHRTEHGVPEIPLKRIDSGPYQHRMQGNGSQTEEAHCSKHQTLLEEIDSGGPEVRPVGDKGRTGKKENTLTRMLRGMRGEKDDGGEDKTNMSLSKIFHRINPVGKTSRDNFSKVFHRIGDALHKKSEDERSSKHHERNVKSRESTTESRRSGENKVGLIGGKMFRCESSGTTRDPNNTLAK